MGRSARSAGRLLDPPYRDSVTGGMRTKCIAIAVAMSSCGDVAATTTATTGTSTTDGGSETTAETTGGCAELPPCDLCPDEIGRLCGLPCPQDAGPCSNPIGDGMTCEAGLWTCVVHPPLGLECNEVCALTDGCSEIGCSSGFTLALAATVDALPVGTYALAIEADGDDDACSFTIADDPQQCAIPPCVTATTCNAIYLLQESPQRVDLAFGVVATLAITVTRDALEVAQGSYAPAYDVVAPNGAGCEPVCAQANAVLPIP